MSGLCGESEEAIDDERCESEEWVSVDRMHGLVTQQGKKIYMQASRLVQEPTG